MTTRIYKTNPRRIYEIKSGMVDISIKRNPDDNSTQSFSFKRIDLTGLHGKDQINKKANIVLEISSNIDTKRFELGTYGSPDYVSDKPIEIEGNRLNLNYYFFISEGKEIKASQERLRVDDLDVNIAGYDAILIFEPKDLGEITWRVFPDDGSSEPIVQVNKDPDVGILAKIHQKDAIYRGLIVINIFEQCLKALIKNPGTSGGSDEWQTKWKDFLSERITENVEDLSTLEEKKEWLESVLKKIALEVNLFSKLKEAS